MDLSNVSELKRDDNRYKKHTKQPSFSGMADVANLVFSQLQSNKIVEYTIVDIFSMVAPRTYIDYTRSKEAGDETAFRETASVITNALGPGLAAVAIGHVLGKVMNNKTKLQINTSLPVNSETAEFLKEMWEKTAQEPDILRPYHELKEKADKEKYLRKYAELVLNSTKGLVGDKKWNEFKGNKEGLQAVTEEISGVILEDNGKTPKTAGEKLVHHFGAEENLRVFKSDKIHINTNASNLVENICGVAKELFVKATTPQELDAGFEKLAKANTRKTILALGMMSTLAFATQFVNRYRTKQKTGSAAFVGLPEESKDDKDPKNQNKESKLKLNLFKGASVLATIGMVAATLTNKIKPNEIIAELKPKKLLSKLEPTSIWSTANQIKLVYGVNILGRILASTDTNELRETDTRDIPGFLNWLVLGGFVSKGVGMFLSNDKKLEGIKGATLINTSEPKKKGFMSGARQFIKRQFLKTHAEIEAMKFEGLPTEKAEEIKRILKGKLNKSIAAGLIYSTVMLGICIPLFNKHVTNRLVSKNKKTRKTSSKPLKQTPIMLKAKEFFKPANSEAERKILSNFMQSV